MDISTSWDDPIHFGLLVPGSEEDKFVKDILDKHWKAEQAEPELRLRREKRHADLNANYARRLGRNPLHAHLQEEGLRDLRKYAESFPRTHSEADRLKISMRIFDDVIPKHPNGQAFALDFWSLHSAIWTEGHLSTGAPRKRKPRSRDERNFPDDPKCRRGPLAYDQNVPSATEPFSQNRSTMAVWKACPGVQGRFDLPLQILKDYLNRELITPEVAWNEITSIPSDDRYSEELRRHISTELARLSQPPPDVEEPAIEALREMLQSSSSQKRRESVKIVLNWILDSPEVKDCDTSQRKGQRIASLARHKPEERVRKADCIESRDETAPEPPTRKTPGDSCPSWMPESSNQEGPIALLTGQIYPKYVHHASEPPRLVNSASEEAALGPDWSETYIYRAYPKCKYGWNEKTVTVKDAAEEATLGAGWADSPAAFRAYQGPHPPRTPEQNPLKWVEEWSVPGLSSGHRQKIKALLLRVDAAFWRLPDAPSANVNAMCQAFAGIAKVFADAGLLSEELLKNEIPQLVWDSAIGGGWFRWASEEAENIFPERMGHYWVWRGGPEDWKFLFYSETAEWLAWLMENPSQNRQGLSADQHLAIDVAPANKNDPPEVSPSDTPVEFINAPETSGTTANFEFTTESGRIAAISTYIKHWSTDQWICSEAGLARTAIVDRADLSRWKKGLLPETSGKKKRVEDALKENTPPIPPA